MGNDLVDSDRINGVLKLMFLSGLSEARGDSVSQQPARDTFISVEAVDFIMNENW